MSARAEANEGRERRLATLRPVLVVRPGPQREWTHAGKLVRSAGVASALRAAKAVLRSLGASAGVSEEHLTETLVVLSEALSNWYRHNPAGDCLFHIAAREEWVRQVYLYPSQVFDAHPKLPPLGMLDKGGMGIVTIRGLCHTASWDFYARGRVRVTLTSREWTSDPQDSAG